MRTTLDIEDSVLQATKELAMRQGKTAGQVVSELLRRALTEAPGQSAALTAREPAAVYGFRPFEPRGGVATNALVDRLRDEEGV